jgi:hypothetical protein
MGYSSIRVTLDGYGHLFPELDEELAASFGAGLVEAREKRSKSTVVPPSGTDRRGDPRGRSETDIGRFSPATMQTFGPCDALTNDRLHRSAHSRRWT